MPGARPLCTSAESNLGDSLGEVEKNSFIAFPGKEGHSGILPLKTVCPKLGGFSEEFYSNSSRVALLIRLGYVQANAPLTWSQVIFLMRLLWFL